MHKSLLLLALLTLGCSQTQPPANGTASPGAPPTAPPTAAAAPEGFEVALSEAEKLAFEPRFQKVDLRRDTKLSSIVLGNYDFELKPMSANSVAKITGPEQMRVHIGLKAGKEATFDKPLPAVEYDAAQTYIDIYSFKNGAEQISHLENRKGKVVLTSVTDQEVVGSVDLSGDGGSRLRGQFKASIVK